MMSKLLLNKLFLSVMGGILLYISWPPSGFPFGIFIALTPVLLLENSFFQKPIRRGGWMLFGYTYLMFLIWNVLTTWWVYNASAAAIIAITLNTLFMCIPIMLYHQTRKKINYFWSSVALISYWLAFEYLHLRWDISWPWLTLGNVFAQWPSVIQWYEYTGFMGGTLWVWVVNILVGLLTMEILSHYQSGTLKSASYFKPFSIVFMSIGLPVVLSLLIDASYTAAEQKVEVMVVQPNLDPYSEKFNGLSADEQLVRMLSLAEAHLDSSVKLLVLPETAITSLGIEGSLSQNDEVYMLQQFMKGHPGLEILTGISSKRTYKSTEQASLTARKDGYGNMVDYYNTAIYIKSNSQIQLYHKSKLVPGVEKMPFPALLKFLEKYAISNGGISGSLGVDESPVVMFGEQVSAAPVICYESIYGDYVREYARKGANLIAIITNDGWWGNTDGYKQHLVYGAIRAIETRRSIARSANTGISAFIDEQGRICKRTNWWEPCILRSKVSLNSRMTIYTRFGDYISLIGVFATGIFLSILFIKRKIT